MTRREVELQVFDEFCEENYFLPRKNWPQWEFENRILCRSALQDIRRWIAEADDVPVLDILQAYQDQMERCQEDVEYGPHYNALCERDSSTTRMYAVAAEMADAVAGLYL